MKVRQVIRARSGWVPIEFVRVKKRDRRTSWEGVRAGGGGGDKDSGGRGGVGGVSTNVALAFFVASCFVAIVAVAVVVVAVVVVVVEREVSLSS